MPDTLGIGVVSFAHGHVGTYCSMIRGFDDAELIAAWDDDEERGQSNSANFGIPYESNLDTVLSNPAINCVMIASETNKHADLSVKAMEAGKNVLLQKPMALTLTDCDRIIAATKRTGQWFSLAFQMRCDPANIHMRKLVRDGAVGRISFIRRRHCIGMLYNLEWARGPGKWHVSAEANKGMFFDDAIHALDWLYWTVGKKPISVIADIDNVLTNIAPDDTGLALYRFDDGCFADIFNSSVIRAGENTTEIYGEKGVIIQNHGDGPSGILPPHPIAIKLYQSDKPDLGWQIQDVELPKTGHGERIAGVARPFIDALKSGIPMCSAEEGKVSVEMCLAAYKSAETGRRVML